MEVWQSPVYCTCLENRRTEMFREFESHRFRQIKGVKHDSLYRSCKNIFELDCTWCDNFNSYDFMFVVCFTLWKNGELAELGLRQRFAKPSTMSSGSLVRIQYSPPKLCERVAERLGYSLQNCFMWVRFPPLTPNVSKKVCCENTTWQFGQLVYNSHCSLKIWIDFAPIV